MDFSPFQTLGDTIARRYRDADCDDLKFAEIAERALSEWKATEFELAAIPGYLLGTEIKQQPRTEFSNLPVTVFRCQDFYIELLIWTDATTAIHRHAFSGAFRVLTGSSILSEYKFTERKRVSQLLLLGDIELLNINHLQQGDVRRIEAGDRGLYHSLFHLDEPSVTMVVRTYGEPWALPQYSLCLPAAAWAKDSLQDDDRVRLAARVFGALSRAECAEAVQKWQEAVSRLDFSRVFTICYNLREALEQSGTLNGLMELITSVHGEESALVLRDCLGVNRVTSSLASCRAGITDPDMRYFLALLLNVQTKSQVFQIMREQRSSIQPESFCVNRLCELSESRTLMDTAFRPPNVRGTGGTSPFILALVRACSGLPDSAIDIAIKAVVLGRGDEEISAHLSTQGEDAVADKTLAAVHQIRKIPELRVFARL